MSRVSHKPREKMWAEYDDTLNWDGHTHDDLLVCLAALQLDATLDVREQNERIITLLQHPRTPTRMDIEIMKYIQDPTDMTYAELMEKLTKAGQPDA